MLFNLPEKPTVDHTSNSLDDSNILRKRLLGAAVLIALAVIFLPLLLDGSGTESRFRRVEQLRIEPPRILDDAGLPETAAAKPVKPEPATAAPDKPVPDKRVNDAPVARATPAAEPAPEALVVETVALPTQPKVVDPIKSSTGPEEPEPKHALDQSSPAQTAAADSTAAGPAVAWVIQAGSFSTEDNALSLRDKIRAAGYPAFVSSKAEGAQNKLLFRVKVGPIAERTKAAAVQSDLQSLVGQKTLIRQYP